MSAHAKFNIEYLDHVAIRVANIDTSVTWYKEVLGLKKYKLEKWGEYPVFMLAGTSGIAIFPANTNDPKINANSNNVKLDHFAFNVTKNNFEKAQKHFKHLGVDYTFQGHHYFHSIYVKDPDNHTVELTTLVVNHADFY